MSEKLKLYRVSLDVRVRGLNEQDALSALGDYLHANNKTFTYAGHAVQQLFTYEVDEIPEEDL